MNSRSVRRGAAVFLLSLVATNGFAATIVESALEALKLKGAEAFLATMTKGSPIEGDKAVLSQAGMLTTIGTYYGSVESWRVLATCPVTDRVKTVFFVVYYEKGPLFGYAAMYTTSKAGDVVTKFFVNTEAEKVFPRGMTSNRLCDG